MLQPWLDIIPPNVLPALVGSLIGGVCTMIGVMFSNMLDARKRSREGAAGIERLKRAISAELKAVVRRYDAASDRQAEAAQPGAPMRLEQNIEENYFVVFEQNAGKLGDIADEDLRLQVINAYVLAKGYIDSVRQNNYLVRQIREFESKVRSEECTSYDRDRLDQFQGLINRYAAILGSTAREMRATLVQTIEMLESAPKPRSGFLRRKRKTPALALQS